VRSELTTPYTVGTVTFYSTMFTVVGMS